MYFFLLINEFILFVNWPAVVFLRAAANIHRSPLANELSSLNVSLARITFRRGRTVRFLQLENSICFWVSGLNSFGFRATTWFVFRCADVDFKNKIELNSIGSQARTAQRQLRTVQLIRWQSIEAKEGPEPGFI